MVLRTIKDGRVTIYGRQYVPSVREDSFAYDGRLDGQRWAFGLYPDPSYVSLWGSEAAYRDPGMPDGDWPADPDNWPGEACIDGVFVWEWWRLVEGTVVAT